MKSFLIKGLAVTLLGSAAVLMPTAGASAGTSTVKPTHVNLRGPLANAGFSTIDPSGCTETDVFVSAQHETEQQTPTTKRYSEVEVSVYKYDACTDTELINAAGVNDSLGIGAFQVSKQLDQASLTATVSLEDLISGTSFPVTVDVDWVGTSDIRRQHSNTNELYPGCHILNRWKGSGREAVATGVVSADQTNLAPTASQWGEVGNVISGFEVMGCF